MRLHFECRANRKIARSAARFPYAKLKRLAAEIRKFPGRGWSVSELAEALGISERALNARFLKLYSRSNLTQKV